MGCVSALPIFPGRLQPSIFGANELNFRVRDGNGWTLIAINTDYAIVLALNRRLLRFVERKMYITTLLSKMQVFFSKISKNFFNDISKLQNRPQNPFKKALRRRAKPLFSTN